MTGIVGCGLALIFHNVLMIVVRVKKMVTSRMDVLLGVCFLSNFVRR